MALADGVALVLRRWSCDLSRHGPPAALRRIPRRVLLQPRQLSTLAGPAQQTSYPSGQPVVPLSPPPPPPTAPPPPPPAPPFASTSARLPRSGSALLPSRTAGAATAKKAKKPDASRVFTEYLGAAEVDEGLANGRFVRGKLHVPSFHTDIAYVITDRGSLDEAGESVWIPVTGFVGRNRAMHGDIVVALPMWAPPSQSLPQLSSSSKPQPATATTAAVQEPAAVEAESQSPNVSNASQFGSLEGLELQQQQLRALVLSLLRDAGTDQCAAGDGIPSLPLSVLGGHPDVRRLRSGLGTLRRALDRMDSTFKVVHDDKHPAPIVRPLSAALLAESRASVGAESSAFKAVDEQRRELCSAVLARLHDSGDGAIPLSVLGGIEQVQRLRKGLGTLSKALRTFGKGFELVEEGSPPETIVKLVPSTVSGSSSPPLPPPSLPPAPPTLPPQPPPELQPRVSGNESKSSSIDAIPVEPLSQDLDQARCRVVAVLARGSSEREIVALLHTPAAANETGSDGEDLDHGLSRLKVQPRDRRFPAMWVADSDAVAPMGTMDDSECANASQRGNKREDKSRQAQAAAETARTGSLSREALGKALTEQSKGKASLLCIVRFVDWPCESWSPRARVEEVLGPQGSNAAESDALLAFYGLDWRPFSEDVEKELRTAFPDRDRVVSDELARGRTDLRGLRCMTIDPPHARDLDDAVSIVPGARTGTHRIGVHIADVTHFVQPNGVVDNVARKRATTVYLVGKVYPMLPRWLSENLCSLLPDGDRLAFSVLFTLDEHGRLDPTEPSEFFRSVIRTQTRLDYNAVDNALASSCSGAQEASTADVPSEMLEDLRTLATVTSARRQLRIGDGAVTLERSSLSFRVDDDGRVVGLNQEKPGSASHHLIEELMVLANHVVALRMVAAGEHAGEGRDVSGAASLPQPLLRRHPSTEAAVRQRLLETLPDAADIPEHIGLSGLLAECQRRLPSATFQAVCADMLTAFKEAEYIVADLDEAGAASSGHWALSLPAYMHFTSPIRRYADVLVHRRLARILDGKTPEVCETHATDEQALEKHSAFLEHLRKTVDDCNAKKRDAQDAQLDAIQLAVSEYVRRSGGIDVEDAVITRIILPDRTARKPGDSGGRQSFKKRLTDRTMKEALEFYVPLAQCTRSVSLESLNLELAQKPHESPQQPAAEADGGKAPAVSSIWVRVRGGGSEETEMKTLSPLTVRVVSSQETNSDTSTAHWTVRLPWAVPAPVAPAAERAAQESSPSFGH